jgi:DNA-directed RNA polymerase subunit alpha
VQRWKSYAAKLKKYRLRQFKYKVNYEVGATRVGQVTDYDKLTLEVWSNGSISPEKATSEAARILNNQLRLFVGLTSELDNVEVMVEREEEPKAKILDIGIGELKLSVRAYNGLKRAGVNTVEDLTQKTEEDMNKMRNLGSKSLEIDLDQNDLRSMC